MVYSGFCTSSTEGRGVEQRSQRIDKDLGILAEGQQGDAVRVVDVLVERARQARRCERGGERRHVRASAKCQQLHEEPHVRTLRLAVLHATLFADVRWLRTSSCLGRLRHAFSIILPRDDHLPRPARDPRRRRDSGATAQRHVHGHGSRARRGGAGRSVRDVAPQHHAGRRVSRLGDRDRRRTRSSAAAG